MQQRFWLGDGGRFLDRRRPPGAVGGVSQARAATVCGHGNGDGLELRANEGTVRDRGQKKGPSRAKIGRWVKACAEAAGHVLNRLDQACRRLVITGCFDAIFFHGNPVLVGVEPHSMAWVLGEHVVDRSGSTWNKALEGFDTLEEAVVAGGRGLQRGLADFQWQRKIAGNSTTLEVRLDVFHTKQEAQRVLRKLWNRMESRWARAELREALVRRWWLRRQSVAVPTDASGGGCWLATALVQTEYCRRLAVNWKESYRMLATVFRQTVRASSAVECMNSVLRMHQGRHRTVTQPMLDLKRLYWNCRPFRSGKRRARSPYELPGLSLPTTDWWQLLHTPPANLTQQVSSSEVTI